MSDEPKAKTSLLHLGLLGLLVLLAYGGTLANGFVWDDHLIIVKNPLLGSLKHLPRLFLSEDTAIGSTGYYRPLTYLSFSLDRALWGNNPFGFHLTNLLLQLFSVLLFYAVTLRLFAGRRLALSAALVFALHPVAGETVNFLAGGRNTLLAACFSLLALYCRLRDKEWAALAFFTLAIFSKEFALLLPAVFLLVEYLFPGEEGRAPRYQRLLLYLVPVACYLALRSLAVTQANFLAGMSLAEVQAAPSLLLRYLLILAAPVRLKVLYDVRVTQAESLLCLGGVALLALAAYLVRRRREILLPLCWFLLFLVPVLNIIPLKQAALMADRYAYFSLMGFAWLAGALACRLDRRVAAGAVGLLCLFYAATDLRRNGIWHDEVAFFTRMTQDAPQRFDGFQNLGMLYYRQGDVGRALPYLSAALSKPEIPAMFLIGSASVFWKEKRPESAETALVKALELEPGNPEPYLMLISLYQQGGRPELAQEYRARVDARFGGAERMLRQRTVSLTREGEGYLARRAYLPAENVFWQALMAEPRHVPALIGMGVVRAERGDLAGAGSYLKRALAEEPLQGQAHDLLLKVYRAQGDLRAVQTEEARFQAARAAAGR